MKEGTGEAAIDHYLGSNTTLSHILPLHHDYLHKLSEGMIYLSRMASKGSDNVVASAVYEAIKPLITEDSNKEGKSDSCKSVTMYCVGCRLLQYVEHDHYTSYIHH